MQTQNDTPSRFLLLTVVVLTGLNLRPFLTAVGPLASRIREATGLNYESMSLFTLVPIILMGACAFAGPWFQRVWGARASVIGALVLLCVACALRFVTSNGVALIGTAALCGLGAAIIQAVFPGIIKTHFPNRVPFVMGLYSSMLMGGGALGAQASPVVADLTGNWRAGLAWIAALAALAALVSAYVLPRGRSAQASSLHPGHLLRRPRTWLLMACFGLVNGGYSSAVAWLAPYYQAMGWTNAASGSLLAIMAVGQASAALLLPALAARRQDRRVWICLTLFMQIAGFAGLAFWPLISPVGWALVLGAGLGGNFALSMVVALDHLEDATDAATLSALMQGGGFLLAAIPPWIVAVLHNLSGTFATGWLLHLACAALVVILATRFAPHTYARALRAEHADAPAG